MMDTNGYWPWSDSAKLSASSRKEKAGAGEMKERESKKGKMLTFWGDL